MQKLVWQNSNGDVIDLTSGNYGITEWEGFSNTSLNIQSQQVPFQDGGVFLDALMEQRELSVTLAIYDGNDLEKRYQYRRELIHILNPKLGEGYLIYTNDFISKRIKCVAQIPLFETHNSNDSGTPKASLAWTAFEPYWEDLEETSVYTIAESQKLEIEQEGDVETSVDIEIASDNISNLKIGDLEIQDLPQYAKISTAKGNKSAYSQIFDKETILYNNEILCSVKIDDYNYCLGGIKSFIIYNVLTNQCKSVLIDYGKYVEDIIKVGNNFYAVVTEGNLTPSNYLNSIIYQGGTGSNSYILKSEDGCESWSKIAEFANETSHRRGIVKIKYNDGKFYLLNRCRYNTQDIELYETEDFASYNTYTITMACALDIYIDDNICIIIGGTNSGGNYQSQAKYSNNLTDWNNLNIHHDSYYADEYRLFTNIIKCNNTFLIFSTRSTGSDSYSWSYPVFYSTDGIEYNYKYFDTDFYRDTRKAFYDVTNDVIEVIASSSSSVMRIILIDSATFIKTTMYECNIHNSICDNLLFGKDIQRVISYKGVETLFTLNQINYDISDVFYISKVKEKYFIIDNSSYAHIYYGDYNSLSRSSFSFNVNNIDTIFKAVGKIYFHTDGGSLYSYDGENLSVNSFIDSSQDSVKAVTFNGDKIYVYTHNSQTDVNKIYVYNPLTNEKNVYTNTNRDIASKIYYVSENTIVLYYKTTTGSEEKGWDGEFTLNHETKTFNGSIGLASDIYANLNNNNGWRFSVYSPLYNLYFLKVGTTPKIYYSKDGISWKEFNTNNISVKSFFYTQDVMCFNCLDGLYTTLNGFEIADCVDDKSKGAGVDENGTLISVELNDDIVSLFLKNYQNIIKQLVNGCNLSLKSGKNELMIYKTDGKGLIILKYRQKYIGV